MRVSEVISGLFNMTLCGLIAGCVIAADKQLNIQEQTCLAMNVYHESRSEPIEGQIAVAHVTLNRVDHEEWPDTICDVVYQFKQFSWTFLVKDKTPREVEAWDRSMLIAEEAMLSKTTDPTDGATFYHADWVNPFWAHKEQTKKVRTIGTHIFYTWDGTWN